MRITEELRPDGSTRYRLQHKNLARPDRYVSRRFDTEKDAKEFVRRAKLGLIEAIAWDDERKGGVSFRGQAGRTFIDYAVSYVESQTDVIEETRNARLSKIRQIERVPSFALLQMGAITHADIERLKKDLTALEKTRGGSLKSRTKNGLLETVFAVMRRAVAVGDIPKDVTMGIRKFKVDDAKKTCPITVPEFDSILIHVKPEKRALFRFLLDSGLRISEALALDWNDIRETAHGIYEVSVWEFDAEEGKTDNAQRITTVPAETFKLLNRADGAPDDSPVFGFTYDSCASEWRTAVHRAQSPVHATEFPLLMKTPTIHDLRHSHAGFLITKCGLNLALVAERLGHKDIGITQRFYGRLVKEQAHELGVQVARNIPRGTVS